MYDFYIWIKAIHVIGVIAWMAGFLYLPRLVVYHANTQNFSELSKTLKSMERRLYFGIMLPAMIITVVLGGLLAGIPGIVDLSGNENWFWVKIVGICILIGVHFFLGRCRKDFALDRNTHSARFFKVINEIPTVIMILIIIMVIIKPF